MTEKKYITKGSITDGPVLIPDTDDIANHERFFKDRLETSSRPQMESELRNLPLHALKNLSVRQRNRLAGQHERPAVNSESREITLNHVSRLAACRLFVSGMFPKLSRTSALFNRAVAYALMSPEEQDAYEAKHPEDFS